MTKNCLYRMSVNRIKQFRGFCHGYILYHGNKIQLQRQFCLLDLYAKSQLHIAHNT